MRKTCGLKSSVSCPSTATYAVAASNGDASTMLMRVYFVSPGGETSRHVRPASVVTCTSPFVVPAHMTSALTRESASVLIAVRFGAGAGVGAPAASAGAGAGSPARIVRSGLTFCHVIPPSLVTMTNCVPSYRACGSCTEKTSGGFTAAR